MAVKMIMEVDASKAIRETKKAADAQGHLEKGAADAARAVDKASKDMIADAKAIERAYATAGSAVERSFGVVAAQGRQVGGRRGGRAVAPHIDAISYQTQQAVQAMTVRKAAAATAARNAGILADIQSQGELAKFGAKMKRQRFLGEQGPKDAMEVFGARMEADRARRAKNADTRQSMAGGAMAVGTAVVGLAQAADQQLTMYADRIVQAEDEMAGLYGVGPNTLNRSRIRTSAIWGSIGSGARLGEIGGLRGRMASAFGDMPADVSSAAENAALGFGKLGVENKTETALGLGALYQTFGKDLGGGAGAMKLLANRLALSADVGAFDPDSITPYLASMGQAFKGAGYKDTDMFASASLASKTGMSPESIGTGVRNLALLMMEKEGQGKFKRTGNFGTDMANVAAMESPELLETFGRDTFVVAKMFADNTDQLAVFIAGQEALTARMDTIGDKITQSMTDGAFIATELIRSARQVQENAPLIQMQDAELRDTVVDHELRKAGAAATSNPLTSWFDPVSVWLEGVDTAGTKWLANKLPEGWIGDDGGGDLKYAGEQFVKSGKFASGDNAMASYMSLQQSQGREAADEWINLRAKGGYTDLSAPEYGIYSQMRSSGDSAGAAKYLEEFGKAAAAITKAADNMATVQKDRNANVE